MRITGFGGRRAQRGASSAEYALLATLIAIAILGAVALFGGATAGLFSRSCSSMSFQAGSCS
jgi:Flp pilus assembly pilin Flp